MPYKLGYKKDVPDIRDHEVPFGAAPLPVSVTLRPKMPPVFEQNWQDCTANAFTALMEYQLGKQGLPFASFSRRAMYHFAGVVAGDTSDDGRDLRSCVKALAQYGICTETLAPYSDTDYTLAPSAQVLIDARQHRIFEYARVPQDLNSVKAALARGYPVAMGMMLYQSAVSDATAASGHMPLPQPGEEEVGGHCTLITGYVDAPQRKVLEVRNSWGPQWGDGGYFGLDFDYLLNPDLVMGLWAITMEANF